MEYKRRALLAATGSEFDLRSHRTSMLAVALCALVLCLAAPSCVSATSSAPCNPHSNAPRCGCPAATMVNRSDTYLYQQLYSPNGWGTFITWLHDNVTIRSNVVSGPSQVTYGKANVIQTLYGINTLYQNISWATPYPQHYIQKNGVLTRFTKYQADLLLNIRYNFTFQHTVTFDDDCLVTDISEFADSGKTLVALPTLGANTVAWMCIVMSKLACTGNMPSFGATIDALPEVTPAGKCHLYWQDAPLTSRDNALFGTGGVFALAKTQSCLSTQLAIVLNEPSLAPYLCPNMGVPIAGVAGCW